MDVNFTVSYIRRNVSLFSVFFKGSRGTSAVGELLVLLLGGHCEYLPRERSIILYYRRRTLYDCLHVDYKADYHMLPPDP